MEIRIVGRPLIGRIPTTVAGGAFALRNTCALGAGSPYDIDLSADGTIVINPLAVSDTHADAAVRYRFAEIVVGSVVKRIRTSARVRYGMEQIIRAYTAGILSVAIPHELAPSVLGSYLVNALASRGGASAGRNGKCLDFYIIGAGFVLAVHHGGLTAGVDYYIIGRFIVWFLYVLDVFGFIRRNNSRGGSGNG